MERVRMIEALEAVLMNCGFKITSQSDDLTVLTCYDCGRPIRYIRARPDCAMMICFANGEGTMSKSYDPQMLIELALERLAGLHQTLVLIDMSASQMAESWLDESRISGRFHDVKSSFRTLMLDIEASIAPVLRKASRGLSDSISEFELAEYERISKITYGKEAKKEDGL